MDNALDILLSWQFILFSLAIASITWVIRKFAEFVLKSPKFPVYLNAKLWNEVLLPIAPFVNGALLGWVLTAFPYPDGLSGTVARVFFGLGAGALSGTVFQMVKGFIKNKAPLLGAPDESKDEPKDDTNQ